MNKDVELYKLWQKSPMAFIQAMWNLNAQPPKPEHKETVENLVKEGKLNEIKAEHFGDFINGEWQWHEFTKGKHITWQQWVIVLSVERSLRGEAPRRISVASGHGIGKDFIISLLVLWYLFCFKDAQIPCTAPTADQMYDILWKEINKWLNHMPKPVQELYEWSTSYVRIKESPNTWFARARTARKESPEALAGMHGEFVFGISDEASGVDDAIYNTAEGIFTNENFLFMMISNPTRLLGYFYESHHKDKANWQTFNFSGEESPVVDKSYVDRIKEKHGEESDEYNIRVRGAFPREDAIDDKGFVPLFQSSDFHWTDNDEFVGQRRMGVDPSGEGEDETVWVVRDNFKAKIVAKEKISTPKTIAQKTLTLMDYYNVPDENVMVDSFGVGADVAKEIALAMSIMGKRCEVGTINVGEHSDDHVYLNKRAESFYRTMQWCRQGGELFQNVGFDELKVIKYKRNLQGKIQIMSKEEMRKSGIPSPNCADALMLTFIKPITAKRGITQFRPDYAKSNYGQRTIPRQ